MKRTSRLIYTHKLIIFNLLLFLMVLVLDPEMYGLVIPQISRFHFTLGLLIIIALFLEYSAIITKTRFIYAHKNYSKKTIPFPLKLLFFPRLVIFGSLLGLAFRGLGMLEEADWLLVLIVMYATIKELWVRGTLFNLEYEVAQTPARSRVILAEVLFFVFQVIAYFSLWQLFLQETPKILKRAIQPQNYAFVAPIFILFTLSVMLPYLVEESFRSKHKKQKVLAYCSLLLPTLAFLLQLARLKYLPYLWLSFYGVSCFP